MKRLIRNSLIIALPVSLVFMSPVPVSGMENNSKETSEPAVETVPLTEPNAAETVASGTCGNNASFTLDKNGVLRITGNGTVDDSEGWYDYTDQIQQVEVSGPNELGGWLLSGLPALKNVILGDSVSVVGYNCFTAGKETALESVSFGSGIQEIQVGAFYGNRNLKKVYISDLAAWCSTEIAHAHRHTLSEVDTSPLAYGAELIYEGKTITELTIPDSVERIGSSAFEGYAHLEKVVIPATVKRIGCTAFAYTPKLTSAIFLGHAPDPELWIYSVNMTYASGIFYSDIGETLTIQHPIGDSTYTNRIRFLYSSLFSVSDPPDEDPNDDWMDIFACTEEEKRVYFCDRVEWPEPDADLLAHGGCGEDMIWAVDKNNVMTISGTGAMDKYDYVYNWNDYKRNVRKLVIEEGVNSIEAYAFDGFDLLKSVLIPQSIDEIGRGAFNEFLPRLKYVCYAGSEEEWKAINIDERNEALLNAQVYFNGEVPEDIDDVVPVTSIKLDITEAEMPTSIRPQSPSFFYLCATVEPENADVTDVIWYSSNPEVATVSGGVVKALTYGQTIIYAETVDGGLTAECHIQTRYYDVSGSPNKGDEAYQYFFTPVYWAADNNITKGYGNVYFGPDEKCTREQMITFLYRTAGSPKVSGTVSFSDVKPGSYYYNAVLWASQKGITNGYSSGPNKGKFGVGLNVTREDTMTFIYRMAGKPKYSTSKSFKDISRGKYYYDAVRWAAQKGITNGYSDGTFGVGKDVLRKDIVTFLYRYDQQ